MLNDPKSWNIQDKYSAKNIDEILPFSERTNSYYARNMHKLKEGHLDIYGAISMLKGIEYHFQHIKKCTEKNKEQSTEILDNTENHVYNFSHELHAYVNRLGQFFYFCVSEFCQERLNLERTDIQKYEISKIYKITKIFRNKHAAHRSRDQPRNENQTFKDYLCLSFFDSPRHYSSKGNRIISFGDGNNLYYWDIITEHNEIMKEAYYFMKKVIGGCL